jgi:hypothetical protein
MDPQVSASFIPKKPLADARPRQSGLGLFFLLALLIFIASLVAGGGVFVYKGYLERSLVTQKKELDNQQKAYDLPAIKSLIRFDTRINEAKNVIRQAPFSLRDLRTPLRADA